MTFPTITAFYAAILALLFVGLSGWVIAGRLSDDTLHGDGGHSGLQKRMRSQGNFSEYIPFALLLIAFLESGGASHALVHTLLIVLVIARLLHPIGMFASKNSAQQFACRGGGIIATLGVMIVAAAALLVRGV